MNTITILLSLWWSTKYVTVMKYFWCYCDEVLSILLSGTCTDRPQVVLKHQPLCPGWEKVPFFSWAQFFFSFINIFRIQISFSVINFPKCVLISEGLFIWVLVRISPRHAPRHRRRIRILCLCSRVLTSPHRASPSSSPTSVLSARPHRCRLRLHWPAASD